MIKKCLLSIIIAGICFSQSYGGDSGTDVIQRAETHYGIVKSVCSNISDSVSKVSGVAKTNAVVNVVGTAANGGALAVGIAKSNVDSEIEKLINELCSLGACNSKTIESMDEDEILKVADKMTQISELNKQIKDEKDRSKTLGNWRTGLMAGGIATNVTSAILAGINRDKSDLIQQIEACNLAVKSVATINTDLKREGISPMDNPIVNKLNAITTWCGNIDEKSVEKIEKQMSAVMGTSIAGTTVGAAGVAVSASAKGDKAQNKKLNTAANVLSGVSVATGAVGIGLNVSMINTAKNIIKQSERCEEALK